MAHLFISYAHEDRAFVERLRDALARDGHGVWWDPELQTGRGEFRPQILAALNEADLVLVAWTTRSRHSRFVADEADIALSSGKLLSLLVDGARPALGFGAIQGLDLSRWAHTQDDDEDLAPLRRELQRRLASGPQDTARRQPTLPIGRLLALCAAAGAVFGLSQAVLDGFGSLSIAAGDGLAHATLAGALSAPLAVCSAVRARRFGLTRWAALAQPFLQAFALALALALAFAAVALAAGVDAQLTPGERALRMLSTVLFATPLIASVIGGLRLLLALQRR